MYMEMAAILGPGATARLATPALPGAPVLPPCHRRERLAVRLLGALPGRRR